MFVKHEHVPGEGQGHSSFFFFFCTSGKPLSQGTYMSNMKALSEMVKKVMTNVKVVQQTNFKVGHRWRSRS